MKINNILTEEPQIDDVLQLELGDTVIEAIITETLDDGVVVQLDETALNMLICAKKIMNESRKNQAVLSEQSARPSPMDLSHGSGAKLQQDAAYKRNIRRNRQSQTASKSLINRVKQGYPEDKKDFDWSPTNSLEEAEYQGRKVQLGKPFLTPGGPKKRSVYVKNKKGNVVKVNFGDPNMRIKKSSPKHRKSFRARHRCDTAKDRTTPRYWSCKFW